jgi:hypothetical protein
MREIKWKEILNDKRLLVIGLLICAVAISGCETAPPLVIQKDANPSFATLGTNVTYTYIVTNNGGSSIDDITIADDALGKINLTGITLVQGGSTTYTLNHIVTQTDLNNLYQGVFIVNTANATGTIRDTGAETTSRNDSAAVATPFQFIQNVASDDVVKLGDQERYEITVCNPADIPEGEAHNVKITDVFDRPVHFVSSNLVPIEQNDTQFTWVIGRIRPKECTTISLVISPEEQETPYTLKSCAAITQVGDQPIKDAVDVYIDAVPDIEELLP